jgi:hypothetical protein
MNTGVRCFQKPLHELGIGIGDVLWVSQRHEVALHVFDPGLYIAFFLRISNRAWRNVTTYPLKNFEKS